MKTSEKSEFDFGTFYGFNDRTGSAIPRILNTNAVMNWDDDAKGEVSFYPTGDNLGVRIICRYSHPVKADFLRTLGDLLVGLGGDTLENYLLIAAAINQEHLSDLNPRYVRSWNFQLFYGVDFVDIRKQAARELFKIYYPDKAALLESSPDDGITIEPNAFFESLCRPQTEIDLGTCKVLIV